jgi:hypothetical protein
MERARAIRRFNRTAVYLPLTILALLGMAAVLMLLVVGLTGTPEQQEFVSGLADASTIMFTCMAMLICAIVPTLFLVTTVQFRSRGIAPTTSIQRAMWRLDSLLVKVGAAVALFGDQLARPFLWLHGRGSYWRSLIASMRRFFRRSN